MKKHIAALLTAVLLMSLVSGCGASPKSEESASEETTQAAAAQGTSSAAESTAAESTAAESTVAESTVAESTVAESTEAEVAAETKIFHIYSFGEDFQNRVQDFYPDYEVTGERSGRIGDTEVRWHVFTDRQQYREELDERLGAQADHETGAALKGAEPDEKIDLFVVDQDLLKEYTECGWSMDVKGDVGLLPEELSDQFLYTQQMATDAAGKLKAVSWQAIPGVFAYRRSIARQVLGTDDPEKVQEAVADWETFAETARAVREAGYYMLSVYEDAYQVYADNVTSAWVEDGVLNIDPHLEEWAVQTREFVENDYIHGTQQWSDEWKADHTSDGEVFGFFYSSWEIHYTLPNKAEGESESEEEDGAQSAAGDYAVCRGPEPSHYGGQWIIAAAGGDQKELAASIMRTLTCDPEVMKKITRDIREFTNSVSGMTELAQSNYKPEVLGGQNPIPVYLESAKLLRKKHTTKYDEDLDTGFQVIMQDYFAGKISLSEAMETFRKVALSRYEELQSGEGEEETE